MPKFYPELQQLLIDAGKFEKAEEEKAIVTHLIQSSSIKRPFIDTK